MKTSKPVKLYLCENCLGHFPASHFDPEEWGEGVSDGQWVKIGVCKRCVAEWRANDDLDDDAVLDLEIERFAQALCLGYAKSRAFN
jgi:hypothetical protein